MDVRDIRLGQQVSLTGEVRAASVAADDGPRVEFLPHGMVRVTLLVDLKAQGDTRPFEAAWDRGWDLRNERDGETSEEHLWHYDRRNNPYASSSRWEEP